jgi:putative ABC transport system ATP-binding protein
MNKNPVIIQTEALGKKYTAGKITVPALNNVTISVQRGEFIVIVGPSGCGKSTLLHLIAGLTTPTEGTVVIEGRMISALNDNALSRLRACQIGFVFQRFNLLPTLTIGQNIAVAQKLRGLNDNGDAVDKIIDAVGLNGKRDRKPVELSIGEQQRAAVARAVIHRPAILLADEPTGNLDSRNASTVIGLFHRMNKELGQTVLLVTHNEEISQYADRILHMRDGSVLS